MSPQLEYISRDDPQYPASLLQRLGADAPAKLATLGNLAPLRLSKTALFCSSRCPGDGVFLRLNQIIRAFFGALEVLGGRPAGGLEVRQPRWGWG